MVQKVFFGGETAGCNLNLLSYNFYSNNVPPYIILFGWWNRGGTGRLEGVPEVKLYSNESTLSTAEKTWSLRALLRWERCELPVINFMGFMYLLCIEDPTCLIDALSGLRLNKELTFLKAISTVCTHIHNRSRVAPFGFQRNLQHRGTGIIWQDLCYRLHIKRDKWDLCCCRYSTAFNRDNFVVFSNWKLLF